MGSSPRYGHPTLRPSLNHDQGKEREGEARDAARAPPGGQAVVIDHRADERPRYVPKALRTKPPGGDLVRREDD